MGRKVYQEKPAVVDRDRDPAVIERRTRLFNQYVMPFLNMIYKLTIQYSFKSENVEENYTEVLTNFYRRIETYDPSRPIRTWLHICTKRHIYALEKRRQSQAKKNNDVDVSDIIDTLQDDDHISSKVFGVENYRNYYNDDILSLLDELKPWYRDALILQEAGYSLKEIAEVEYHKGHLKSKNIETVKSRLRIARLHLKNNLNRNGERIYHEADAEDVY